MDKRKVIRLKDYDYSKNGVYFLTICTLEHKCILGNIVVGDGALDVPNVKLSRIGEIVEKHILSSENIPGIIVNKYVIMPNHIHLLLEIDLEKGSSKAPTPTNALIPHTVSTFKRFVNREIGYNIFQRSYYEHIIRNEKDYFTHYEYIENNPIKWETDDYYIK